jgi:hypothetical protein
MKGEIWKIIERTKSDLAKRNKMNAEAEYDEKMADFQKARQANIDSTDDEVIKAAPYLNKEDAIQVLDYWIGIAECDCLADHPTGGCRKCDLEAIRRFCTHANVLPTPVPPRQPQSCSPGTSVRARKAYDQVLAADLRAQAEEWRRESEFFALYEVDEAEERRCHANADELDRQADALDPVTPFSERTTDLLGRRCRHP